MRINLYNYLNVIGFTMLMTHFFSIIQIMTLTYITYEFIPSVMVWMLMSLNGIFLLIISIFVYMLTRNYMKERRVHRDMLTGKAVTVKNNPVSIVTSPDSKLKRRTPDN